ncbi:MAG: hypothetical protein ABUL47_02025 [Leifsonia sp.]
MYAPHFGWIAGVFAAIVWAIGTLILIAIAVAVLVLLVRFLWFGTKAARRYLEVHGQPAARVRMTAATPAAGPAAPAKASTTATTPATTTTTKPSTPPKPKP